MTMLDNRMGFGASLSVSNQYSISTVELNDNIFYGETPEISDCPEDGSYCKSFEKFAIIFNGAKEGGPVEQHITMMSEMPMEEIAKNPVWGLVCKMSRNKFMNFISKTALGRKQGLFFNEKGQADYIPMIQGFENEFVDLKDGAFATISDPNPFWANLKDCGDFPCTAPANVLISMQDTVWTGIKPRWAESDFQVISNNTGFAPYIEGCTGHENMNAYICESEKLGILIFESEDADKWDRSLQPIYVKKQGTLIENKLNSVMDHLWDGFYTGQVRLSRFHSIF
jgi:hypothetical protein